MRPAIFSVTSSVPSAVFTRCDDLLDADELGKFLGLGKAKARADSARAAINMRIRRKHPMPPSIMLPGLSGRRWLFSSVVTWLKTYEKSDISATPDTSSPTATPAPTILAPRRRRGRPTKAEAMARRAETQIAFDSPPGFERR